MASSILSEPHPPRDVISVWNLLGLEGLILSYSQYKDRRLNNQDSMASKAGYFSWLFRIHLHPTYLPPRPMHGSGVFHNRLGPWKFRTAGSWKSHNWKGNPSTKKNSMGSNVDFSGEYRQKPQIQWFSPNLRDFICLESIILRTATGGSLPLWMTQMSLLLEMTAENLHPVF